MFAILNDYFPNNPCHGRSTRQRIFAGTIQQLTHK